MDMNNFRAESHVAQQSRRDKLRVHQNSTTPTGHLEGYTSNFEELSSHQELNPNFIQVRNFRYANPPFDGSVFSSEVLNFSTNSLVSSTGDDGRSCANPISSKLCGDPQNFGAWKTIGSQQCCDSIVNYSSGSRGIDEGNPNHPMFVEEGLSGSLKATNISSSQMYMKPSYNGCQYTQKHFGEMHFGSPIYQNTLQDVVTSAATATATKGLEMASLVQSTSCDAYERINRPVEDVHQWNVELGYQENKSVSNTQGLALSLSSVPRAKPNVGQFGDKYDFELVNLRSGSFDNLPSSKTSNPGCLMVGNTNQDVGISTFAHRNTGPLGPFTGYATILKNSKFLKPTQLLLDEFCSQTGPKLTKTYEAPDKTSEEVRVCAYSINTVESVGRTKGGDSGASSSTFRSSNEMSGECGVGFNSSGTYHPEYQQTKAKLIYMHEEVCKRFKQYHQQMQMVVSSFESVAGLSAATPYISLALKTVSRHFRSLKNAISDQLSYTRKALGEDMSSPTTGTSSCKGDTSTLRLNFVDHGFQKHKSGGGGNLGFFEPQQHVWRPQRGLPERAVAILRAWLFDHFLHPYPTDTDKHMLATQTGLSRNQVSNWFINARVRVWKPMVEEIHTLETKNLAETNSNPSKFEGKQNDDQSTNRLIMNGMSNSQVECSEFRRSGNEWNQDKRSRTDYFETPVSMDGPVLGFVPYQRSGLEFGGLGPVSLTLGLRQSENGAQHQQELQGQRMREQFGGQMIHDFVG